MRYKVFLFVFFVVIFIKNEHVSAAAQTPVAEQMNTNSQVDGIIVVNLTSLLLFFSIKSGGTFSTQGRRQDTEREQIFDSVLYPFQDATIKPPNDVLSIRFWIYKNNFSLEKYYQIAGKSIGFRISVESIANLNYIIIKQDYSDRLTATECYSDGKTHQLNLGHVVNLLSE